MCAGTGMFRLLRSYTRGEGDYQTHPQWNFYRQFQTHLEPEESSVHALSIPSAKQVPDETKSLQTFLMLLMGKYHPKHREKSIQSGGVRLVF